MQKVNTQPAFPSVFLELKEKLPTGLGIMCMNLCLCVCFSVYICVRQREKSGVVLPVEEKALGKS